MNVKIEEFIKNLSFKELKYVKIIIDDILFQFDLEKSRDSEHWRFNNR